MLQHKNLISLPQSNDKNDESQLTWATNIDLIPDFSRKVSAISGVGDLEATAISTPLSLRAYSMPLACGYNDGMSRLDRYSLQNVDPKFTIILSNLLKRHCNKKAPKIQQIRSTYKVLQVCMATSYTKQITKHPYFQCICPASYPVITELVITHVMVQIGHKTNKKSP